MKAQVFSLLLLAALLCRPVAHAQEAAAPTPGFDCQQAEKVVEHWICASPELMQADLRLNEIYRTAQAKPDSDTALAALRSGQLRWLRQRNRCESQDCVAQAYTRRTAELQASNRRVQVLDGVAFAPVFSRTLDQVNDTRAVHGIPLRRAQPTAFEVELYIDPQDARPWSSGGPGARIACWPPDRQEGYASRFSYEARSWGDAFRPIERDGRQGYILLRFVLGKDLPLNEDIFCSVALTEWLLDQPSQLHLVESAL
jgi:uncharacterized protein